MAGSITTTTSDLGGGISKYSVAWVSSAGGVVSANTLDMKRGYLVQAKFVPDSGGTQPTDQYDVTLTDTSGVDIFGGAGANLSNAAASIAELSLLLEADAYTPTIANAGNVKGGTIILLVSLVGDAVGASSIAAANEATAANQVLQLTQETAVNTVLGLKADAKSTATDTTSISIMSVLKQISASIQAAATSLAATLSVSFGASATGGYSFLNIAAGQATTVVKASAGTLHSITLNSAATATNVTTVYDHPSSSGTIIAKPNVVAATVPTTLIFDIAFANGLTIITGTANGGDMTVCYK